MCSICGFMYFQPDIISESNQRRGGTNFRKYYDVFGNPWNSSLTNYPRRERDMFAGIASNQVQAELRRLFNAETEEFNDPKLIPPIYNLFEERLNRNLFSRYLLNFYRMNLNEFIDCEINLATCHSCSLTYDDMVPWKRIICESFWWSMILESNNYQLQCECAQHHIWQSEDQEPPFSATEFQGEEAEEKEEVSLPVEQQARPRPLLGTHHHNQGLYPAKLKNRREKRTFGSGWRGYRGHKHRSTGAKANAKKSNVNSH